MKNYLTFRIAFVCLILFINRLNAQQIFIKKSIYFETAKHELLLESKQTIDNLLDSLSEYQIKKIIIRGNTDNIGDSLYNIKLSERRTNSTRIYLLQKGIIDSIIKTDRFGENKPIADNLSDKGKQTNRRVDLLVYYSKPIVPDTAPLVHINQLYRIIERPSEKFIINPNRDTVIKGSQGSIVLIKSGTFKTNSDCKNENISFYFKEAFLKSDIIIDNLSTTSNDKILESQAMVFSDARDCNNNKIEIQKGKVLTIMTPTDTFVDDTKLFQGNRTSHDSIMNWSLLDKSEIDGISMRNIYNCFQLSGCGGMKECNCNFFVCRIGRLDEVVKGWFVRCNRRDNKLYRQYLKRCRSNDSDKKRKIDNKIIEINQRFNTCSNPEYGNWKENECDKINKLLEKYNLKDMNELLVFMNKNLLDSFGISTMQELYDTMQKIELQKQKIAMDEYGVSTMEALKDTLQKLKLMGLENQISEGTIDFNDLKYYMFNSNKLGWNNIDIFAKLDLKKTAKIKVDIKSDINIDCKLVFKNRRIILPASVVDEKISFQDLPSKEEVYLVVIKYYKGKVYLYFEEFTSENTTIKVKFEEVSLEELKEKLKLLNAL